MRWLAVHPGPAFSVADVYAGWVEALRGLGENVATYNLDDRLTFYSSTLLEAGEGTFRRALTPEQARQLAADGLYGALYQAWPDVLFVVSAFFVPTRIMDIARDRGTKVVVLHTESPYEDERQLEVAAHADWNLINDPTNMYHFQSVAPTRYMPHAYRPSLHHPGPAVPNMECDFAFVGTGYPSRISFFEQMDLSGMDVVLAGNWQALGENSPLRRHVAHDPDACLDNAQTADVYRSARVGMNLYRVEAQKPELSAGWSMGPREVEMAATGLFFLRDPRPESDSVFPMLPAFTSPAEATEQLRWWLDQPDIRREAASKAREAVADRTFRNHAAQLLRWLDKE